MSENNSDYKKSRTELLKLLPDVYRSDVNRSLLSNVFDRFLSKDETKFMYGIIGENDGSLSPDPHISESSPHRQAFQLQPLLYAKVATIDHISSYEDLLREAELLGIESSRLPLWGDTQQFNFAPPINFDKLVNYSDYYWYDTTVGSVPQYITIHSDCNTAVAKLRQKQAELSEFGYEIDLYQSNTTENEFILIGNYTNVFIAGIQFLIYDSSVFNGTWTTISSYFDNGKTYVKVGETISVTSGDGTISFENILNDLRDDVNCVCENSLGWDKFGWDDNNCTLLSGNNGVACSGTWDTSNQAGANGYDPALNNVLWDYTSDCATSSDNPWSRENKWIHKLDLTPEEASVAIQATMPIIEYSSTIELNAWTYTNYTWMYRASSLVNWESSNTEPTLNEVTLFDVVEATTTTNEFIFDSSLGDIRNYFTVGETFSIQDGGVYNGMWTIQSMSFTGIPGSTRITVVETIPSDLTGSPVAVAVPVSETSKGDTWLGFFTHWALVAVDNPVPVNQQTLASTIYFYQETLAAPTTVIDFSGSGVDNIALGGFDDIRVYVDGIREYGTFSENVNVDGYVDGITFFDSKPTNTVIVIEVSAAALLDVGREAVLVRTTLSDSDFTVSGPELRSLVRYRQVEQTKLSYEHKYPLFDLYNVDGTSAYKSSPIFAFQTSADYPIDSRIDQRVVTNSSGKEFYFEQYLIEEDNGSMYCYKDFETIDVDNPTGLQTIWRAGTYDEFYVPSYVNEYRRTDGEVYIDSEGTTQIESVPYGTGSWEIPDQLYYNASHENRKIVSLTQLNAHFKTIIEAQELPYGFYSNATYAYRLLNVPNVGLGGTIKEFNDSYDLFLSTMYMDNSNPLSVLVFANEQYDSALNFIGAEFRKNLIDYLLNDTGTFISDLSGQIAEAVIELYETNDAYAALYGDTTAYDGTSGVQNWIATIPMFKLGHKIVPVILSDSKRGINEVLHHDGHISSVTVLNSVINNVIGKVISTEVSPGRNRGWTDNKAADGGTIATRLTVDWTRLLPNDYWQHVDGTVYRLTAITFSPSQPSSSYPDGTFYVRSTDGMLMVRDTGSISGWVPVNGTPGDMTEAWQLLDIPGLLTDIIYEIEQRLYDVSPDNGDLVFDFSSLTPTSAEQAVYDSYLEQAFIQYARERRIEDPYASDYQQSDPFTWNYSTVDTNSISVYYPNLTSQGEWGARWYAINEKVFGTPYPHLEPWKLQGYDDKPEWWDEEFKDTSGNRRWLQVMWDTYLFHGNVPAGRLYPDGSISTGDHVADGQSLPHYAFFSVNTTNDTTTDGYGPDDLLPPYWVPPTSSPEDLAVEAMTFIRSYTAIPTSDIDDSYVFGDIGPVEWLWRKSSQYLYDQLKIAFLMQPVRFLHYAWGIDYTVVGGLQVNSATAKVYSHRDTDFHGDLTTDGIFIANGINQWYVNFNRFGNYDSQVSDFYELWRNWDATLAYQFDSMIDAKSLDLTTKAYNFASNDYQVLLKRTPGFKDFWIDSLKITIGSVGTFRRSGSYRVPVGYGEDWDFVVDAPVPISRNVEYYGVQKYAFDVVDPSAGLCQISGTTLPWNTGDAVNIFSFGSYPRPFNPNTELFIYKVDDQTFKLATSYNNATLKNSAGVDSPITVVISEFLGDDQLYVESNIKKYEVDYSSKKWRQHKIRLDDVNSTTLPVTITGMQNLLDFIDGYSARLNDLDTGSGFAFNKGEEAEVDAETGKIISWHTEKEKMIDAVYTGLGEPSGGKDRGYAYNYTLNTATNEFTLTTKDSMWNIGQEVYFSTNGTLPTPLMSETSYFVIPVSTKVFKLASSYQNAINKIPMDIISIGTGVQYVGEYTTSGYVPASSIEVNPFRHNLWVYSPEGVLADVIRGPYQEIRIEQTIYDQYGRPFSSSDVNVYRSDKLSQISVREDLLNDVNSTTISGPNRLHLGGMHAFLDGYEHIVLFNHYTSEGFLVYDAFIGLNTPCMSMYFARQEEKSRRPNVGGYFIDVDNQLVRNLEASVVDMLEYYDTYKVKETADHIDHARALLGYESPDYFDHINLGRKSKFLFWKNMIQHKGSINSINAFINSAHFIDAKVDEFWAYKLGEFGDSREQSYPAMRMFVDDVDKSDLRLHFGENVVPDDVNDQYQEVLFANQQRWVNLPDIIETVGDIESLYFNAEVTAMESYTGIGYHQLPVLCDVIKVIPQTSGNEADVTLINSGVLYVSGSDTYDVYMLNPAKEKLNPSKIIDTQTSTVLYEVPFWDPARGHYTPTARSVIDVLVDSDPVTGYDSTDSGWTDDQVGTVWLDTSALKYVPYFDENIFSTLSDRLRYWGQLADWADVKIYEWTKSPVPPSEWGTFVSDTQGDNTLSYDERGSGTVRQTLFYDNAGTWDLVPHSDIHYDEYVAFFTTLPTTVHDGGTKGFSEASLYVNGVLTDYTPGTLETTILALNPKDHVHLVNSYLVDGVSYKMDTNYVQIERYNNGIDLEYDYYFWVEDKSVRREDRLLSLRDATTQFKNFTSPFQLFTGFVFDDGTLPNRYTKMIVRNVKQIIDSDDRYIYRFTRDFALRDHLNGEVNLKNIHTQWTLFREQQPYNVPQYLWNKMVEALVGYDLVELENGNYQPVPSLERVLYDGTNDELTRFGFGDGQAFCDKTSGLDAVLTVINQADFDPQPVNKTVFLEDYSFDTPLNIKVAMEYIYNNFPYENVNEIYFAVLHDALATKIKYEEVFKTSMIALHGIRVLETAGNSNGNTCQ